MRAKGGTNAAEAGKGAIAPPAELGPMPVWDLTDLYPAPESEAVQGDLKRAAAEAAAIKERYQGKLAEAAKDGASLAAAVRQYESLSDTLGRLGSYAGLLYAADTANPQHAKFYGDIQEKL